MKFGGGGEGHIQRQRQREAAAGKEGTEDDAAV
jgi:hypothetical protein